MSYPKPLSEKSLKKMYDQLGISEISIGFLHKFFLASANLYGSVYVRDLWEIYKEYARYADVPKLHRKDFVAFSAIARRDDLPYYVFEIDELYSEEPKRDLDRCVVLKSIIREGYGRLNVLYNLHEMQCSKPYYIPQDLLAYANPQISEEEKQLRSFLENLKVEAAQSQNRYGKTCACNHVGKRLNEFDFLSTDECFDVKYYGGEIPNGPKRNQKKLDAFWESRRGPESEKLLRDYKERIWTGWVDAAKAMKYLLEELTEVGVILTDEKLEKLVQLTTSFQNNSHLWSNCGWTPVELMRRSYCGRVPTEITFGPGIEKAIAEGTMNRNELVERLKEMGIEVV